MRGSNPDGDQPNTSYYPTSTPGLTGLGRADRSTRRMPHPGSATAEATRSSTGSPTATARPTPLTGQDRTTAHRSRMDDTQPPTAVSAASTAIPATDPTSAEHGAAAPGLFTPAQAAALLKVPESWLRRRAARHQVPCTMLGKHLHFSAANLDQIVADAARPAAEQAAQPQTRTDRRPATPGPAPGHIRVSTHRSRRS